MKFFVNKKLLTDKNIVEGVTSDILVPIINSSIIRSREHKQAVTDKAGQSYKPIRAGDYLRKLLSFAKSSIKDVINIGDVDIEDLVTNKKEQVKAFLEKLIYRNEVLINLEYFVQRSLKKTQKFKTQLFSDQKKPQYQKPQKEKFNIKNIFNFKPPKLPSLTQPHKNNFSLDHSSVVSSREQIFLQYVFIIVGGALILVL